MKEDIELLNYIYQNAKMGLIGISNIKDSIKNKKLLKTIKEQENDYFKICTAATELLTSLHEEREDISSIAQIMTYIDAKVNTMTDNSTINLARMMINGNTKGIVEIQEKIKNYHGNNNQVLTLAKELLKIEKRNTENLTKFL